MVEEKNLINWPANSLANVVAHKLLTGKLNLALSPLSGLTGHSPVTRPVGP